MRRDASAFRQVVRLSGSFHGADFYGLPRNETSITLERTAWNVPESFSYGQDSIVPLRAGGQVNFQLVSGSAIERQT